MTHWKLGAGIAALMLATSPVIADRADAGERQSGASDGSAWNEDIYVKGEGGWIFRQDTDIEGPVEADLDMDDGWVGGVAVGTEFKPQWRAELGATYETLDTDAADNAAVLGGDVDTYTVMATVYRDFDIGHDRVQPFVGAGVGAARISPDFTVTLPGGPFQADETQTNFAWQVTAGVGVDVTHNLVADLRYRYLDAGKYDIDQLEADYRNHAVLAGLRYTFGADAPVRTPAPTPVPAAAQPAPPPPPAPAPVLPRTQREIVYFPLDSARITPTEQDKIDRAAAATRTRTAEVVRIEGHTDTTGPSDYNLRLSERRAQAVRNALIAQGVPASLIVIEAKGESDLRVNTTDGVASRENRRSEIVIKFE